MEARACATGSHCGKAHGGRTHAQLGQRQDWPLTNLLFRAFQAGAQARGNRRAPARAGDGRRTEG